MAISAMSWHSENHRTIGLARQVQTREAFHHPLLHIAGQIQPAQSILSCYIFTAYIFSYEDACGTLFVKEDLNSLE